VEERVLLSTELREALEPEEELDQQAKAEEGEYSVYLMASELTPYFPRTGIRL
jgi:hypothetical protein